jgi:hypothetical protein
MDRIISAPSESVLRYPYSILKNPVDKDIRFRSGAPDTV